MTEDVHDRLDRLESQLEDQQATIEDQQATIEDQQATIEDQKARIERQQATIREQRERIRRLEDGDESGGDGHDEGDGSEAETPVSRRDAIRAGGLLALVMGGTGVASADPQGQVGTQSDPLNALYTAELNGPLTGDQALTDLLGAGLSISSGTLNASGASSWADGDSDGLLEPKGSLTGIDVADVQTDSLNGGVTGGTDLTSLTGDGVTIASNALAADLGGGLETNSGKIRVNGSAVAGNVLSEGATPSQIDLNVGNALTDNSGTLAVASGAIGSTELATPFPDLSVLFGSPVTTGATLQSGAGNALQFNTDGGTLALALAPSGTAVTSPGSSASAPTVVAGHPDNGTGGRTPVGATVSGGGDSSGNENVAYDNHATVGGGRDNRAGTDTSDTTDAYYATVGGGEHNEATGKWATVSGGSGNSASGIKSTVAGGGGNTASGKRAIAAGGLNNDASGKHAAVVGGGDSASDPNNVASGTNAAVIGGFGNTASASQSVVLAGDNSTADGNYSLAAGRVADTGGYDGAYVFADSSTSTVSASAADQFVFQATGGFLIKSGGVTVEGGNLDLAGNSITDSSGNLTLDSTLDTNGNDVQSSSGNPLQFNTDGGTLTLELAPGGTSVSNPGSSASTPIVVAGHPNNGTGGRTPVGATVGGGGDSGGNENVVYDNHTTVAGGRNNQAGSDTTDTTDAYYATVGGGESNQATGKWATVSGGATNSATGTRSTVAGGGGNTASGKRAIVAGGLNNDATGKHAAVVGGGDSTSDPNNVASGINAAVLGGFGNSASGDQSVVLAGDNNTADGKYSLAAGRGADTNTKDGAVVFADSTTTSITASSTDQVRFQQQQFFIGEGNLPSSSGAPLVYDTTTGEVFVDPSSARYKTNIEPLSPEPGAVLELEPREFEYKERSGHGVGLIAEEVEDNLPDLVNTDAEGRPDSVNYDRLGVYLIPEVRRHRDRIDDQQTRIEDLETTLDEKDDRIEDQQDRIEKLETENDRLRERNAALESRLERVESELGIDDPQEEVTDD